MISKMRVGVVVLVTSASGVMFMETLRNTDEGRLSMAIDAAQDARKIFEVEKGHSTPGPNGHRQTGPALRLLNITARISEPTPYAGIYVQLITQTASVLPPRNPVTDKLRAEANRFSAMMPHPGSSATFAATPQ